MSETLTNPRTLPLLHGAPPDLERGIKELDDALPDYEEAERYFEGNQPDEFFASARIRRAVSRTGIRYKFRLAKIPVQVLANRVKLSSVQAGGATDRIEEIRDANFMDVIEPDLHLRTFEYGDAYLIAWPYEDAPEDPTDEALADAGVEIQFNSPKCMRVIYDTERPTKKSFAVKRWQTAEPTQLNPNPPWRADLYYRDRIERYTSRDHRPGATHVGSWEPFVDEDDPRWPLPNPFGEIPVFHFRTGMPYGKPEHADAFGPQDAINKLLITQLTTVDSHGWPQRYKLTDAGAELDNAADDPDWDDDADAIEDTAIQGGVSSSLRSGPGTLMTFTGTKAVGQFPAADTDVFGKPVDLYVRLMAQLTDTPLHYFDPTGSAPSGESLKTANAPLDAKAENRELLLGGTWREFWRFALKVVGVTADVEVDWAPGDLISDKEFWETAAKKHAAGVPWRQILLEANYRADQIAEWDVDDDEPEPPAQPPPPNQEMTDGDLDQTAPAGGQEGAGAPGRQLPGSQPR